MSNSHKEDDLTSPPEAYDNQLGLEIVTAIINTNLQHARHIETQRMILAFGYSAAMFALIPLSIEPLIRLEPTEISTSLFSAVIYSAIAAIASWLSYQMTVTWNRAFHRWISAAQVVADKWAKQGKSTDQSKERNKIFGFKYEDPNDSESNSRSKKIFNSSVSTTFESFYLRITYVSGGIAVMWGCVFLLYHLSLIVRYLLS